MEAFINHLTSALQELPDDNVTLEGQEQYGNIYTAAGIITNGIANQMAYELDKQSSYQDKLKEETKTLATQNSGTEFFQVRSQSLKERRTNCQVNLEYIQETLDICSKLYKQITGNTWQRYVKQDPHLAEKADLTQGKLEILEMLIEDGVDLTPEQKEQYAKLTTK